MLRKLSIMALLTAITVSTAFAATGYYSDSQKGFWWYEKPVKKEEPKEEPKPKKKKIVKIWNSKISLKTKSGICILTSFRN